MTNSVIAVVITVIFVVVAFIAGVVVVDAVVVIGPGLGARIILVPRIFPAKRNSNPLKKRRRKCPGFL